MHFKMAHHGIFSRKSIQAPCRRKIEKIPSLLNFQLTIAKKSIYIDMGPFTPCILTNKYSTNKQ